MLERRILSIFGYINHSNDSIRSSKLNEIIKLLEKVKHI